MSLAAYLPADRRRALAQGRALPDRANGAALFADISGFTPLTEGLARALGPRLGAEELAHQLNLVYDALIAEVNHYGGSVVFFSGDSITCWFSANDERGTMNDDAAAVDSISSFIVHPSSFRAVACALAMQAAMRAFAAVPLPNGTTTTLSLKVAIASGSVRRFVVGDPIVQCRDVLAGATLERLVAAEHLARPGEVLSDSETTAALGDRVAVREWRVGQESSERFAVLAQLEIGDWRLQIDSVDNQSTISNLQSAILGPWLLPAVYARLAAGHADVPIELRPATALLLRFGGLDYDGDALAGSKLDGYVRWVQRILLRYGGTLIDLTISDKGCYFYCAFGAPATHENDTERALRAALELLVAPPELAWVGAIQIGISQGTMRTGAYGGAGRLHYGVLGDAVNTAARPDDGRPFRLKLVEGTPECMIDLGALAVDGVRALATQALGGEVSNELATFLFDKTGGNPFFVEQLALDLRERGALAGDKSQSADHRRYTEGIDEPYDGTNAFQRETTPYTLSPVPYEVPAGVNAVLVARLDRLAAPVREVVQTAAVLGREWPLPVLWEMLRRPVAAGQGAPGRAARSGRIWAKCATCSGMCCCAPPPTPCRRRRGCASCMRGQPWRLKRWVT